MAPVEESGLQPGDAPSKTTKIGIIYPPPEVRSILLQRSTFGTHWVRWATFNYRPRKQGKKPVSFFILAKSVPLILCLHIYPTVLFGMGNELISKYLETLSSLATFYFAVMFDV